MQSLDAILRSQGRPATTSGDRTGTSTSASGEDAEEPCPLCQGAGFLRSDVPLGHPDFGRAWPCHCTQEENAAQRLARLQRYSNLGGLTRLTFDNWEPSESSHQALEQARAFCQQPEGWLTLIGPSGSGKTHLAAAITNRCLETGRPVLFFSVADLLDHLRAAYAPTSDIAYDDLFLQVRQAPLLVLDDLGGANGTPWAKEKLYQLINYRYAERLPTVITLAASLDQLDSPLRARLTDPTLCRVLSLREARLRLLPASLELPQLRTMTFEKFDTTGMNASREQRRNLEEALRTARGYAEDPDGWLVFSGTYGVGKTHLAAAIAHARQAAGQEAVFVVVPDLLDHLRSTFRPESEVSYDQVFEAVRDAELLVLDDLGSQSSSTWAREKLFQILNYRHNARLATVITTQQTLEEIGGALTSRLSDWRVVTNFLIDAPDYRTGPRPPERRQRPGTRPPRPPARR